jgi:hypothetical protein
MSKAYKLKRLEELMALKKSAEARENVEVERSEPDPAPPMPEPGGDTERPIHSNTMPGGPVLQPFGTDPRLLPSPPVEPRPESLRGISALDLACLDVDGLLTPREQVWYRKRSPHLYPAMPPGPHDWMKN